MSEMVRDTAMTPDKSKMAWPPEEGEVRLSETLQRILTEEAVNAEVNHNADISAEEGQRIVSSIVEDANEAASDIASYIYSHKEEFGLSADGTPRAETPSSSGDCWIVVGDKIKTFFACKFIKEAVVSSAAKLRKTLVCFTYKKPPLDDLIVAATEVVRSMTPPDNDQDDVGSKQLVNVILENIPPDHGTYKDNQQKVSTEVSKLMTHIWSRFNKKNDSVNESLIKIMSVVEDQLTEAGIMTPVKSAAPSIAAASGVSDEEHPESVDEDEEDELPEEELAEDELAEEELPEGPEPITGSTRQTQPSESTDLIYTVLTSAVINLIVKNSSAGFQLSSNAVMNMTSMLKAMLCAEMAGSESVETKLKDVKKIAKAVYKNLRKYMGSKGCVAMNLMSQDSLIYAHIVQTIKRRLVKPKKTGVKRFFSSIHKIVTKPFTRG